MNSLRKIREEKGMTQVQLAAAANVTQGMISAYENGVLPTLPIALRISRILGASLEDLFPMPESETKTA